MKEPYFFKVQFDHYELLLCSKELHEDLFILHGIFQAKHVVLNNSNK